MARITTIPTPIISDLTFTPAVGNIGKETSAVREAFFPSEWFPQSGIQMAWPHKDTDWKPMLKEVTACYLRMAYEIAVTEPLVIVTPNAQEVRRLLEEQLPLKAVSNIQVTECPTDDTWSRDNGFLTIFRAGQPELLDFGFNGWGNKFPAQKDNAINTHLYTSGIMHGNYSNQLDFILEGGSVETDGRGTLLTTSRCLLHPERNSKFNRTNIEEHLKKTLCIKRVLWLENGGLEGDDTDGHIDTLARFCPNDTIAYVQCNDDNDPHYDTLKAMEQELQLFTTPEGEPYRLLPLPMPRSIVWDGERLPATYANFLITNGRVLMPTYQQPDNDTAAAHILQQAFPHHDIIPVDCLPLIRQHGSLHCSAMQFPRGVILPSKK